MQQLQRLLIESFTVGFDCAKQFSAKGIVILKLYNYNEVKYLVSKGVKFGENGISATRAKNRRAKTWYLTESRRNMSLLNNFRKHSIGYTP